MVSHIIHELLSYILRITPADRNVFAIIHHDLAFIQPADVLHIYQIGLMTPQKSITQLFLKIPDLDQAGETSSSIA